MGRVPELYGTPLCRPGIQWPEILREQTCPYINRRCLKVRKSIPTQTIGTCSVEYGKSRKRVIICPYRLLEKRRVFVDCLHLLTLHEPGNDWHIVTEVSVPGGSVDYFLVSARNGKVKDFLGVEFQALDTTGTVWPARQQFLSEVGVEAVNDPRNPSQTFGLNWKMTAKTMLLQLHHELETFEHLHKHLVLVVQDHLVAYVRRNFRLDMVHTPPLIGDSLQIYSYTLESSDGCNWRLSLAERLSTDTVGVAGSLGLRANPRVELARVLSLLEDKLTDETLFLPY